MSKKLFLLFLTLFTTNLFPQPKQAITINPLGFFWGVMNLQYEFRQDNYNSIAVRGNYVGYDIGYFSNSAFGFGGSYRWYRDTRPVVGLWYGPSVDILFWQAIQRTILIDYTLSTYTHSSTFLGIGGDIGYKWNFNQFGVELFGGVRYYFGKIAGLSFGGATLVAGLSLGYLW